MDDEGLILTLLRELAEYEKLLDVFHVTEEVIRRDYLGARPLLQCDLAFEGTEAAGIMTWELDVQLTRDSALVVFHDETLDRTFGVAVRAREVPALTLMQHGVPHLADMLALLPGDAFLDIELKEAPTAAMLDTILAARGPGLHRAVGV